LGQDGKARFFRTLNYQGKTSEEKGNETLEFSVPPTLLPDDENVFDLGDYAEALANRDLFQNDDTIQGKIEDLVTKQIINVGYNLGDGFEYGSSREGLWGPEFKIFSNQDPGEIKIENTVLAKRKNDPEFWRQIVRSADWQVYREPTWSELPGGLDSKPTLIREALANHGDASSLDRALGTLDWNAQHGREYLGASLLSTEAPSGSSEVIRLNWFELPQGGGAMTPQATEWLVRIGGSEEWKVLISPVLKDEDIRGLWSLEKDGRSGLLLTAHHGFYRTRDGGLSWEAANYGETGFTSGTKVKPVIVNDATSTFALIDRGTIAEDGDNPLFRLQHRNWLRRWSAGIAELFK
jgi:hypothetical protein